MIARRDAIVLGLCGAVALLTPIALLSPHSGAKPAASKSARVPLAADAPPPLARAYERPLFGGASADAIALPADAPALVGVVGRLGADAVALVRTSDGTTRSLRIGDSVDGWQLASLSIDAAFFTRGAERVRVPLPAGE